MYREYIHVLFQVLSANRKSQNSSEVQADFEVERNGTQLSAAEAASALNVSLPTVIMNLNGSNISVTNLEIKALQGERPSVFYKFAPSF